jgi:hypothetical protein
VQADDDGTFSVGVFTNAPQITVVAGVLSFFTVTGEPATIQAGQQFPGGNDIIVTAFDQNSNIKTDYLGTIEFTTTDPNTNTNVRLNGVDISGGPSLYNFVGGDSGTHTFANTGFILETPGNQTISVNDTVKTNIKASTGVIVVTAGQIATFTLTAPGAVTAGTPFSLSVSNARDAIGNPASGIIDITWDSSTSGFQNAPDGTPPSFTQISVTAGTGSAFQTMTRADTNVVLRGTDTVSAANDVSNAFTVNAGSLDAFNVSPAPTNPAADTDSTITLTAFDVFENPIPNFTPANDLTFTANGADDVAAGLVWGGVNVSDNADLTGTLPAGNAFNAGGQYVVTLRYQLAGDPVTPRVRESVGGQEGVGSVITWQPAALDHFAVTSISGGNIADQIAGAPFDILITAQDAFDNTVTAFNGAGNTVDISDTTTSILPAVSGDFTNGVRTQTVTVTTALAGNIIALDHFTFSTQPVGPYQAGDPIAVIIRAEDVSNNLIGGFNGTAVISDNTLTIGEGAPGSGDTTIQFVGGIYDGTGGGGTLFITQAQTNIQITVTLGGISNSSNQFDVTHASLDHFLVEAGGGGSITDKDTDNAFNIDITAQDVYDNTVVAFDGVGNTVDIADTSGSIAPGVSADGDGHCSGRSWYRC